MIGLILLGLTISSLWCLLYLLFDSNGLEDHYDLICSQWDWILWTADFLIIAPYALRAMRIIFIFTPKKSINNRRNRENQQQNEIDNNEDLTENLSVNSPNQHSHQNNSSSSSNSQSNNNFSHPSTTNSRSPVYHRILTSFTLLKYFLLIFISFSSIKVLLNYEFHFSTSHGFGCPNSSTEIWELLSAISLILLIYILNRLKDVKNEIRDDFGQLKEFTFITFLWSSYWIATVILGILRQGSLLNLLTGSPVILSLHTYRLIHTPIILARNIIMNFITILYPIYLSYSHTFSPLWSSPDSLLSLDSLLKDIICIQYFRSYLLTRQRVQFVLCWVEIELFKDFYEALKQENKNNSSINIINDSDYNNYMEDGSILAFDDSIDSVTSISSRSLSWSKFPPDVRDLIRSEATRIFSRYFQPRAEMDVGLSAILLHRITRDLTNDLISLTIFDDVSSELYTRMNEELGGFLASRECEKCWQELDCQEKLKQALCNSGMLTIENS